MDRARLDSWLEKGILGIVTLILILGPLLFGAARVKDFQILQGLAAAAALLWAARLWTREDYRLLWPPFAWTVVAFLAYALWHYSRADVEYIARLEINRIVVYATLFVIILDSLNRQEWSQTLVVTMVFVGMAMSMYAVYQYITGSKLIWNTPQPQMYWGRAGGTYVCPNHLAGYLAMIVPMGLALAVGGRFHVVMKVVLGYAALVMLAGVYVTVSRGGWIATAVGLSVFFAILISRPGFRLAGTVMLVLLLGTGLWFGLRSAPMKKRAAAAISPMTEYRNDRQYMWGIAREIWQENFWVGSGPAHFDVRFREKRPAMQQFQARPNRVHNDYLNTVADWGFVGLSIIAAGMAVFWLGVLRIWRFVKRSNEFGAKQSTRAAMVLGASAGLVAILAHSLVDFNMHIPANAIVAVTLMAVITGHWRFATERFWFNPRVGGKLAGTIIALGAVAWLGSQVPRLYQEQTCLARSERFADPSPERLEWLRKAAAVEPMNPLTAYDVGENIRRLNWEREKGFEPFAKEAEEWFRKTLVLDKFSSYGPLGIGMCQHWIGKSNDAWPWFREAIRRDRNSFWIQAHYGWHFLKFQDYDRAHLWFKRSLWMRPEDNPLARAYYDITERRISEEARGQSPKPPSQTE